MNKEKTNKLNFGSKNKLSKSVLGIELGERDLKFNDGYVLELVFRINSYSRACLLGSELKFIFHCTVHSEIFVRSLFRLTVFLVISCTVENEEVSSAKSFGLDCKQFGKSFMHIKNNKGPKLIFVERLHSSLSMMRTDHLKLLFVCDFSKSLLKDIEACLLSPVLF